MNQSKKWKRTYERGRKLNTCFKQNEYDAAAGLLLDTFDASDLTEVVNWESGETLREAAADKSEKGINFLRLLLSHGADPSLSNPSGETALMLAAEADCAEAISELLRSGDKERKTLLLEQRDSEFGKTALLWAAEAAAAAATAKTLLDAGADVDARCELEGRTALMICAESGNASLAALLLSEGADVMARDAEGKTAADIAKNKNREGCEQVLRLLLQQQGKNK